MQLTYEGYLTEQKLGQLLKSYFRNVKPQHILKLESSKCRVDYFLPDIQTIVEFDGHHHYQQVKTIYRDKKLDEYAKKNGMKIVHHPYWLQLDDRVFYHHFGEMVDIKMNYPHGFIDPKCMLPADFCSEGWNKFFEQYSALARSDCWSVMQAVYHSIENQIKAKGYSMVLPAAMQDPKIFLEHYPT